MFDPYYETKVNQKIPTIPAYTVFFLIPLGLSMIAFTIVDLNLGMTRITGSAWQENSIWPSIGKGIWVGAILVATGVIGLITVRERTQVGLYIFNGFTWASALFSLYLGVTSILHFHPYLKNNIGFREMDNYQANEYIMNVILCVVGFSSFLLSVTVGLLSCRAGNCFLDRRKYDTLVNDDTQSRDWFGDEMSNYTYPSEYFFST